MPVDDAPVHELTRIDSASRYKCHNRKPYAPAYYAPDRIYRPDGTFYVVQTRIVHAMSRECRFDMYETDPRCAGCTTPKDVAYLEKLNLLQGK